MGVFWDILYVPLIIIIVGNILFIKTHTPIVTRDSDDGYNKKK